MSATVIDGKTFAEGLRGKIARQVELLREEHGLVPGLAVVLVGQDPASEVYVRSKGTQTRAAGMASFEHKLPETAPQSDVIELIERLNADPAVHGILVQLPRPNT
jgi:methylenetetrahydrofolate dehydrogenase (NADP+)/methenyltetrahydrofolate cyclohydrolase